ncbi:MAG TPA: hypothetical protein PKA77_03860 [Chitinophagaceae bacterium]|jgi:hypothetical protein|nr:hypothetical protein [Chitinophagaceae bacterium]HMU57512.1 hypothetical protein [Chitinophagaceae bacterium]
MNYWLVVIFSFSISIAAITGWVRFRKMNPAYYPFIYCIWLAFLNEMLSFIFAQTIRDNSVNNNLYALAESLLIVWQFRNWGIFKNKDNLFYTVLAIFTAGWVTDHFILNHLTTFTYHYRIAYSFVTVLFSVNMINTVIVRERKSLLKNPAFLICTAYVINFTYYVMYMTLYLYSSEISWDFLNKLTGIMPYANLLSNLLFALAVLWIPARQRFTLPT